LESDSVHNLKLFGIVSAFFAFEEIFVNVKKSLAINKQESEPGPLKKKRKTIVEKKNIVKKRFFSHFSLRETVD
jgi:hypothetical protein